MFVSTHKTISLLRAIAKTTDRRELINTDKNKHSINNPKLAGPLCMSGIATSLIEAISDDVFVVLNRPLLRNIIIKLTIVFFRKKGSINNL